MSSTPGNANRALPVLSVMMRQADDGALRDAAGQAASIIARAMGYKVELPPVPEESSGGYSDGAENGGDVVPSHRRSLTDLRSHGNHL